MNDEPVQSQIAHRILRHIRTVGKNGITVSIIKKDMEMPDRKVRSAVTELAERGEILSGRYIYWCAFCNSMSKARSHSRLIFFPEPKGVHWEKHFGGV